MAAIFLLAGWGREDFPVASTSHNSVISSLKISDHAHRQGARSTHGASFARSPSELNGSHFSHLHIEWSEISSWPTLHTTRQFHLSKSVTTHIDKVPASRHTE
jgi:hypothetical protein